MDYDRLTDPNHPENESERRRRRDEEDGEGGVDTPLHFARLIVEGGWTEQLGLTFEQLFPNAKKGASKEALARLERKTYSDLRDKEGQCLICLAEWAPADTDIIVMPCKHSFHSACVLEWLKRAASCPACRHELPSDDPVYEEYKRQQKRKEQREKDIEELHDSMFG